jgi:hypothetical protein
MTVALSILFAAVVGGVVFLLLDKWQRQPQPRSSSEPAKEIWTPSTPLAPTTSLFVPPSANAPAPFREQYPQERTEPLPPSRGLWDDPPRRADDDDDDRRPPGLWSGWAR